MKFFLQSLSAIPYNPFVSIRTNLDFNKCQQGVKENQKCQPSQENVSVVQNKACSDYSTVIFAKSWSFS